MSPIDPESAGQISGASREGVYGPATAAAFLHPVDADQGLQGTDQDRLGSIALCHDDVQAVVQSVHQIDVRAAARFEHRAVARGVSPAEGVCRMVFGADIGLDLDDSSGRPGLSLTTLDDEAEQIGRDLQRWTSKESLWQRTPGRALPSDG